VSTPFSIDFELSSIEAGSFLKCQLNQRNNLEFPLRSFLSPKKTKFDAALTSCMNSAEEKTDTPRKIGCAPKPKSLTNGRPRPPSAINEKLSCYGRTGRVCPFCTIPSFLRVPLR
jgi:hypothetical protein